MIDFHTHTLLSDGELLPSELIRRCAAAGYRGVALTDHVDSSNIDFVVPCLVKACQSVAPAIKVRIVPGAEITHAPARSIPELVKRARSLGAALVLVHGETIVDPVEEGTNRAAIEAGADILAHPGLISEEDARLAAKQGVFLELSARKGHCLTNGHVVRVGRAAKAKFVLGTDTHDPSGLLSRSDGEKVARGARLDEEEVRRLFQDALELLERKCVR